MEGLGIFAALATLIYGILMLIVKIISNIFLFILKMHKGSKKTISRTIRQEGEKTVVVTRITVRED